MTVLSLADFRERPGSDASRWTISSLAILAVHAVALLALLTWRVPIMPAAPPPAAIMIDLAPVVQVPAPAPTPAPPQDIDVPLPPPLLPLEAAPNPVVEAPPPRPKTVESVRRHIEQRPKPAPIQPPPTPVVTEQAPTAPPATPRQAEPSPSVATAPSPDVLSNFERLLLSHLEREKRYPRTAQIRREQGVVDLRFVMDRAGKVLSAVIAHGSGFKDLDAEVLALIRRAEPLPSMPADIPQAQLELIVPVRFFLR